MAETLRELIARVLRALPAESPDRWGDFDIQQMLNKGQDELAVYTNQVVVSEINLPAETSEIDLPEDLLKLVEVYWGDEDGRRRLIFQKEYVTSYETKGDLMYYNVLSNKLKFWPVPDVDSNIYLVYVKKPTPMMKNDDEPAFEGSGEVLVAYTLREIYMENSDPKGEFWDIEYNRQLMLWKASYDQHYQKPFQVEMIW